MAPVLLKRWSPLFDPEREQIGAGPLWVRLPGLPLQYWCEEAFIRIGNALGTYLDHDRTLVESSDRTVARILVHLDTREGLVGKITLLWGNYTRVQILDYEGVPFRCWQCYKVGHLFKDCHLNKKVVDIPIATTVSTRTVLQTNKRTLAPGLSPSVNISQQAAVATHSSPSPPITRSQAAAEAAKASGNTTAVPTNYPRRSRYYSEESG